jgi:hypothetical protein
MNLLTERTRTIGFLSWKLGVRPEVLASVLARDQYSEASGPIARYPDSLRVFYRRFSIPKSGNKRRIILSPQGGLRIIQNAIYQRLLKDQKCSEIAHGFVPGRSVITALLPHAGAKLISLADMQDAFASVPRKIVRRLMAELGFKGRVLDWMVMFVWEKGLGLPQGAPTSGMLFNLACRAFDKGMIREAALYGYTVTRYADNIIISATKGDPISFKWNAHNCITKGLWEDEYSWSLSEFWIQFGIDGWDREKIYVISNGRPARTLGAILDIEGGAPRLSGKTLRRMRLRAYNAVLAGDWQVLNGIKGFLLPWFGEIPPQVADAITKAQARLESLQAP